MRLEEGACADANTGILQSAAYTNLNHVHGLAGWRYVSLFPLFASTPLEDDRILRFRTICRASGRVGSAFHLLGTRGALSDMRFAPESKSSRADASSWLFIIDAIITLPIAILGFVFFPPLPLQDSLPRYSLCTTFAYALCPLWASNPLL